MSEDDGPESGCDTVEGSPSSERSTSPQGNNTFHYLGNSNRNRPPLAAMVAPMPPPAVQDRRPCNIRTMVVPPMTVQNNNSQGTEDHFQRTSQWFLFLSYCIVLLFDESLVGKMHKCSRENKACSLTHKKFISYVCVIFPIFYVVCHLCFWRRLHYWSYGSSGGLSPLSGS